MRADLICSQVRGGALLGIGCALLSVKPDLVQLNPSAEVRYCMDALPIGGSLFQRTGVMTVIYHSACVS